MNSREEWLRQQITEVISSFEREQMSVSPNAVSIALHPRSLVVTLCGAACPAEMELASNGDMARLLERFYAMAFDACKIELEQAIASILGRRVTRSKCAIDPQSGDGVLLFALSEDAKVAPVRESPKTSDRSESNGRSPHAGNEERDSGNKHSL
ncbi:MAG: Na-translocating system protein MpsC family protein [Phycisphaerae bacterium]